MNDRHACGFLTPVQIPTDPVREAINCAFLADETEVVRLLLAIARFEPDAEDRVNQRARSLVSAVRARRSDQGLLDAFMQMVKIFFLSLKFKTPAEMWFPLELTPQQTSH